MILIIYQNTVGLGEVGLGWVGLGWVGLGWVGLGWDRIARVNVYTHTIYIQHDVFF
jgi:hypothetical protein